MGDTRKSEPLRFLMVEDNPADTTLLEYELKRSGVTYVARRVDREPAFREALREFRPSLIFSDYNLPSFDGLRAMEIAFQEAPDVPFIFVTGTLGEESAVELLKRGATDYVLKGGLSERVGRVVIRALHDADERRVRRGVEEELRVQQERLNLIFDTMALAIYVKDAAEDFRTVWISENVERMTGYPPVQFVNEPGLWLSRIHEGDRSQVIKHLGLLQEKGSLSMQYRWQCSNGDYRWFLDKISLSSREGRADRMVIGSWVDVTDYKKLESQFHQAQKMEALGRLTGGIAHDFNNLLTVIIGNLELVLASLPPQAMRQDIQTALGAGKKASLLARQLLSFSRPQTIQTRELDLNAVVQDVAGLFGPLVGEDVHVVVRPGKEIGRIAADPAQVEQIIVNLVVNARDAMPEGGAITIETSDIEVAADDSSIGKEGPYVLLTVSDTGVGMSREILERIFEPFFTTKEPGKGTGLGLSTIHGIVNQCGGHVTVYSEPGMGTTFKIFFPRIQGRRREVRMAPLSDVPTGSETILLVEDDAMVRRLGAEALRKYGYTVLEAARGEEALAHMAGGKPGVALVLTDVVLPDISGPRLVERIRGRMPGLKCIFTSGHPVSALGEIPGGDAVLESEFLQKPFSIRGLMAMVRQVLDSGGRE